MIQLLAHKCSRTIATTFLLFFYFSTISPLYASRLESHGHQRSLYPLFSRPLTKDVHARVVAPALSLVKKKSNPGFTLKAMPSRKVFIGGPGQPEMASFKSVGTGNMVNLFSGDFNYNIPLLDVGGYPINIFYEGGVGMEQEASWVGLGWNINPGNVSRNMRGVPDDFNGQDSVVQTQMMKPNITWGVSVAGDLEGIGIKENFSVGASIGISFNNYLGPALDLGVKGGMSFKIAEKAVSEKKSDNADLKVSLAANVGSRSGVSFSPSVSLSASSFSTSGKSSFGIGASTTYNSRYGIKALNIYEQFSYNKQRTRSVSDEATKPDRAGGSLLMATSISFAKPSYMPAIRMPVTNTAYAGHFQLGGAIWGVQGSIEAEVYKQTATVSREQIVQSKPLVGYIYYENAMNNPNAVMDFTRFNDREVTPNTPIISAPQYTYDVFTIQGEGTGGSIRAYRNELGYVRDNYTTSKDKSASIGGDVGIPGQYGLNLNRIKTPVTIGEWNSGNKLKAVIPFKGAQGGLHEAVYFRNPGESSVLDAGQYNRLGGIDLVRFKLGGSGYNPEILPVLERFSRTGSFMANLNLSAAPVSSRTKRTQVISFLTAKEAHDVGLDKYIKSYDRAVVLNDTLIYESINRVSARRKAHHISQINVLEANGKRYVYGIPVYNITQRDFTFSVQNKEGETEQEQGKVQVSPQELTTGSAQLNTNSKKDGFLQISQTPAYAHSFLLSGLLSPDYVDITDNGITEDDLGDAIKFNYSRMKRGDTAAVHRWRTPLTPGNKANFNEGNRSELKDDKGIISYGERESWYTHSIESKNMIALFTLENRDDGKGTLHEYGGIDAGDSSLKRLKRIDLYNKADLKKNGLSQAKPVKSVHFAYSYLSCPGTPDNTTGGGKLTLDSIYFTFNGQKKSNKNKYVFSYVKPGGATSGDTTGNPVYSYNSADRWGTYKPRSHNPANMKNADYPYCLQDKIQKQRIDLNAGAWSLQKVLLPSGGQIEVSYETDDYAFVQNRRATAMLTIAGFGRDSVTYSNKLYEASPSANDNDYVFVKVPERCINKQEVFRKYLHGNAGGQLAFRLSVNMPKGEELLTSYAVVENYGIVTADTGKIWLRLKKVNGLSPLSITALEYLREQLPGQAFPGYDVSESAGLKQVGDMLVGMLKSLQSAFRDPVNAIRSRAGAQTVNVARSSVRLNDPDGFKYGGGHRVKVVTLKDNWKAMTGQYTSSYGQQYDYTTTEIIDGIERTVSSGVASYEPSIGAEENPFQSIVQVSDKLPLGPANYGSVEMPVLDAFFPAPSVGYSKVTVRSLRKTPVDTSLKVRSVVGKQVTEFFTAKDFPVYYSHTSLDPGSDKQAHDNNTTAFFYKSSFDSRALSQGFLVETNDMHGKMKSQASYAENDEKTPVNYTRNYYRNTGSKGLNEQFDFVHAAKGGTIEAGTMGIDVELMTDTREFLVASSSLEIQAQLDLFPVILPFWLPFIWPVIGKSESNYRAVTTTKVVTYHSVLDSVTVIDKGSQVSTRNLVYDAETGEVVVNRTNNEFKQPVYSTTYPAYWAYSGMGLAYKNIDVILSGINFNDGRISNAGFDQSVFESGDELYVTNQGAGSSGCAAESGINKKLWAIDKNKDNTPLTVPVKDLLFMDLEGNPINKNGVSFRIMRSGKRNLLNASISVVKSMGSPISITGSIAKLKIGSNSNVTNASAVEFKEKWQVDADVIRRYKMVSNPVTCSIDEMEECNGYLDKSINPYCKGLLGNFRSHRNMIFYGNRSESDATQATNLRLNGSLMNFSLYWDFNGSNNLVPDVASSKWVWQSEAMQFNAKGMELETRDALNIYTAAQYGFNKAIPVAITNNSRCNETVFEGFEDMYYNAGINRIGADSCASRHIDLSNLPNSRILNTDTTSLSAHSGKYMLGINANSTSTKTIKVGKNDDPFTLAFQLDTAKVLADIGVNVENVQRDPVGLGMDFGTNSTANQGVSIIVNLSGGDTTVFDGSEDMYYTYYYYGISVSGYFEVNQDGFYSLGEDYYESNTGLQQYFVITTLDGQYIVGNRGNNRLVEYCFPKGIYKMTIFVSQFGLKSYNCPGGGCGPGGPYNLVYGSTQYMADAGFVTYPFALYQSVNFQNGCISIKPLAATKSMLNPVFEVPSNKKMLFSAWVKEDCGNGTPCNKTTYADNKVIIQGVEMRPAGSIIDGWQRYEGTFTVPNNTDEISMSFVNSSSNMTYFDDIRIHPFNGSMKSFVYDPINMRLKAELDENNYARFYEYDEEGTLVRTKAETKEGIKTITESRSARQKKITTMQQ